MIAGTSGDCGKTLIALGLAAAWRREGLEVAPFKKGPDYIDAAWLSLAAGRPARNLDTWMMGAEGVLESFAANAIHGGINLVEGNRGLHDGEDAQGHAFVGGACQTAWLAGRIDPARKQSDADGRRHRARDETA